VKVVINETSYPASPSLDDVAADARRAGDEMREMKSMPEVPSLNQFNCWQLL
jgi:hypothetical protein